MPDASSRQTLLKHLDVEELTGTAGGDPWQLNKTIQSGSPGEINELATAFYDAGVCMGDTSDEFNAAKTRFEAAWDRGLGCGELSGAPITATYPLPDQVELESTVQPIRLPA